MRRQRLRKAVVGAGLSLAVATGVAACGSSAKSNNSPVAPAGSTNAATTPSTMAPTTPPTTAPRSGGVSY